MTISEGPDDQLSGLTFDQLRTLVYMQRHGSPRKVAMALRRDQSSVVKQVEVLNRFFSKICGEELLLPRGRGEDWVFTPTGRELAKKAEGLFEAWSVTLEERRRSVGKVLKIGTTTFTLPILARVWGDVCEQISTHSELVVSQVRTSEFRTKLADRSVDLIIGGSVERKGTLPSTPAMAFQEWRREEIVVLTNLSTRELPGEVVSKEELAKHQLIMPEAGLILDAAKTWFGELYPIGLRLTPRIQDVYYGVNLLRLGILHGAMFATKTVAHSLNVLSAPLNTESTEPEIFKLAPLRTLHPGSDFDELELVSGLLGRQEDVSHYSKNDLKHPLSVFWRVFAQHAKQREHIP